MICGGKSANTRVDHILSKYQRRFRFTEAKLKFYIESFIRIGNSKFFTKQQFRENMGLLGLENTCMISDRIFSVMCQRNKSCVYISDYLEYMDILLYGSPAEKAVQSFKLITDSDSDGITFEDFVDWLVSVWKMYNSLTGYEISTSSEDIKKYFEQLDRNQDGIIDLQEYKEALAENKNLYEWFEFANRGVKNEEGDEDEIEMDKWAFEKSLHIVEKDLKGCIEMIGENRGSQGIGSYAPRLSNRVSVTGEDLFGEAVIKNKGDLDLPEEFDLTGEMADEEVDRRLLEILGMVKEMKEGIGKKERRGSYERRRNNSDSSVSFN